MNKEINLFEREVEIVPQGTALPNILEQIQLSQEKQKQELQMLLQAKRIIEALLFASNEPLSFNKLREVLDTYQPLKPRIIRQLIEDLQQEYATQGRAFRLEEIAQGFILHSCEEYSRYIEQLHRNKRSEKLSQAASEVLAIIAFKQPITKPQIEAIRGVDSTGTVQSLLERGLIEAIGKLEAPGRPTLYGITKDFLTHFGLKDLEDLKENKIPFKPQ